MAKWALLLSSENAPHGQYIDLLKQGDISLQEILTVILTLGAMRQQLLILMLG